MSAARVLDAGVPAAAASKADALGAGALKAGTLKAGVSQGNDSGWARAALGRATQRIRRRVPET